MPPDPQPERHGERLTADEFEASAADARDLDANEADQHDRELSADPVEAVAKAHAEAMGLRAEDADEDDERIARRMISAYEAVRGERERNDLRQIGDLMQSSLSRLVEWVERGDERSSSPYEIAMACSEGRDAIEDWTRTRRAPEEER